MINGIGILIGGANQLSLYFKKIILAFQARVVADSGIFESFDCMKSSLKTITKPLYEQASLVITPNGYKENKLYVIKPDDGSGDLVVTRATTATRVNSDGLIEQVPYNLLTYSQDFSNSAWEKLSVGGASIPVVTANSTTAPDGNLTADKIVFNAPTSGDISILDQNISLTGTATGSFYIKAFSSTDIGKIIGFRFSSGTYSLVTLTDSWQRVSVTATALSTFDIHLRPVIGTSSGTVSIYLWGAQLVSGTSAKEYFPTTDRLDVPRLDYTGGSCPSILVEPQRTNVLTYSEQFDNAAWEKIAVGGASVPVVTANSTTAPDGNLTADKIVFNAPTSGDISILDQNISLTGTATGSFYIKAFSSTDIGKIIGFRFSSGTYSLVTLTDSWQRVSVTATALSTFDIHLRPVIGTSSGTVSIYLWGAQLEAGSYATSYIPTVGSSVTRNADVISKTGISNLINSEEGVLFADIQFFTGLGNIRSINISNGDNNNRIGFYGHPSVANRITFAISSGGNTTDINYNGVTLTNRNKVIIRYSGTTFTAFVNGVKSTNQTFTPFAANFLNRIGLDYGEDILRYEGIVNSIQLYKTALTDQECIDLTTI